MRKDDIIKDGEDYFSIFCVMGSVVYVKRVYDIDVNGSPMYELTDVLKQYRKIEIMKK